VCTNPAKLVEFVRKNRNRKLLASVVIDGENVGLVGGSIKTIAVAIGDHTSFEDDGEFATIGTAEFVTVLDVSKMGTAMFKMSGLAEVFTTENVTKVMFDVRRSLSAMKHQYKCEPCPLFDLQICDIAFRDDTQEERLQRLRRCFHYRVFDSPGLVTSLDHCVRLNTFEECLKEHKVGPYHDAKYVPEVQPDRVVRYAHDALNMFELYRGLERKYKKSHLVQWGEVKRWSVEYSKYYPVLHSTEEVVEVEGVKRKAHQARTGEGIDNVFYHTHSMLPLAIMPRRAMIGSGREFQVGRLAMVDRQTKKCQGCMRVIGPLHDCFVTGNTHCHVCHMLNRSFDYRKMNLDAEKQEVQKVEAEKLGAKRARKAEEEAAKAEQAAKDAALEAANEEEKVVAPPAATKGAKKQHPKKK